MSDINELFSRDPLSLTNEDIDAIIEEMRQKRHLFSNGGGTATAKKPLTAKQQRVKGLDLDIDI